MNRSISLSVAVLLVSLFVGSALQVHAATTPTAPAPAVEQSAGDDSTDVGYWAAWADAVSH